ncbi:hypothetical protein B9G98_03240 [Wickerhamiella sorbophila]|uniref:Uncharacterized protein n=1 Tax=Wickerhamiella sorbophila TaxID=45607 RepID=A0A2T0FKW7_9ASCO|nr:hypothetical protein B9G98_03240 [Wickerhamiella sorbophila]PRT55620.1 hypothetical protein B9G98_03240 [Wickerhamiella sorbophila]
MTEPGGAPDPDWAPEPEAPEPLDSAEPEAVEPLESVQTVDKSRKNGLKNGSQETATASKLLSNIFNNNDQVIDDLEDWHKRVTSETCDATEGAEKTVECSSNCSKQRAKSSNITAGIREAVEQFLNCLQNGSDNGSQTRAGCVTAATSSSTGTKTSGSDEAGADGGRGSRKNDKVRELDLAPDLEPLELAEPEDPEAERLPVTEAEDFELESPTILKTDERPSALRQETTLRAEIRVSTAAVTAATRGGVALGMRPLVMTIVQSEVVGATEETISGVLDLAPVEEGATEVTISGVLDLAPVEEGATEVTISGVLDLAPVEEGATEVTISGVLDLAPVEEGATEVTISGVLDLAPVEEGAYKLEVNNQEWNDDRRIQRGTDVVDAAHKIVEIVNVRTFEAAIRSNEQNTDMRNDTVQPTKKIIKSGVSDDCQGSGLVIIFLKDILKKLDSLHPVIKDVQELLDRTAAETCGTTKILKEYVHGGVSTPKELSRSPIADMRSELGFSPQAQAVAVAWRPLVVTRLVQTSPARLTRPTLRAARPAFGAAAYASDAVAKRLKTFAKRISSLSLSVFGRPL